MATPRIVTNPNKPGVIFVPELGEEFLLSKERDGAFYDTTEQGSGAITAGAQLVFFRDFANKNAQHVNVGKNSKLPSGNALAMVRSGVLIAQAFGNVVATDDDVLKIAYAGSLDFKVNERVIQKGEPPVMLPTGYGIQGSTTRTDTGIVTTGVPAIAAAPMLRHAQPVLDRDDLNSILTFPNNAWGTSSAMPTLDGRNYPMHVLYGTIKQPVAN